MGRSVDPLQPDMTGGASSPAGPHPAAELDEIEALLRPLSGPADLDPLLERIGDARYVLLGEASHGTSEYYTWRATISRRLISEHGFSFVAVEGDWPDCFDVNCWVKGRGDRDRSATGVLARFDRWPTWMWANREVAAFVDWLREHNATTGAEVGFYGLDVYSLWESMDRIVGYLGDHEPAAIDTALEAMRCFEPYGEDPQRYAFATRMLPHGCEDQVIQVLSEVRDRARPLHDASESEFDAWQNAEVVAGAERYYRAMVAADEESWNVRDCHMADTLDRLMTHHGMGAKAIVWEHNTHVGDARATDMAQAGMINVGQIVRQRHGRDDVVLVGFGGHDGTVLAARQWGAAMERMPVPVPAAGHHEALIHKVTTDPALIVFPTRRDTPWLAARRGHRAIGVVYHPEFDAIRNWVPTVIGQRYDALISFGHTESLHALHLDSHPEPAEQDTYPWNT